MKKYTHILLFTIALLFGACSTSNDPIIDELPDGMIEIRYSQSKFDVQAWNTNGARRAETRAVQEMPGTESEKKIDNIYVLMFGEGAPIRYFHDGTSSTGVNGAWNKTDRVLLKVSQAVAGTRNVYVIANIGDLKTQLDGVTTADGLKTVLQSSNTPWSTALGYPSNSTDNAANPAILMSGTINHNFSNNRTTSSIDLIRALAKVELTITLGTKHQDADATKYKYNFVDFDKNTYVLENLVKTTVEATSGWQAWSETGYVSTYTIKDGKVEKLTVVTYINETTNAGSYIDIQLPYNDGGLLPPPEFGNETFQLLLPDAVVRNTWYKYDITI